MGLPLWSRCATNLQYLDFKIHIGKKSITETKLDAIEANIQFLCALQVPLVVR